MTDETVGLLSCMMTSQQVIAKWAMEHPGAAENFYIKRWRCEFETGKEI
jgi:hypothetical protein